MNKPLIVVALGVALVVLFPPCDYFTPATQGVRIGDVETGGTPERRNDRGFVFIGDVGGQVIIRQQQWLSEIGGAAIVGALLVLAFRKKP